MGRIAFDPSGQPKHIHPVTQAIFGGRDLHTMLHEPLEKRVQVVFLATDLPHTANINVVHFPGLDLPQHIMVAGAQQPATVIVCTAADYIAAISLRLQGANLDAVHGSFAFS